MRLRTPTDIGQAIRERRRALGLDQKTLAGRVGVSRQWVIDAEKGKRRAELGLILRTLEVLGLVLRAEGSPRTRPRGDIPSTAVSLDGVIAAHRRGPRAKP